MPRKKTVDPRLTKALATIEAQKNASAAQQAELEQLRGMVAAAKPGRAFRPRTLYHGGLDVKLKGVEVAEDEVWIEHRGEVMVILVGNAARAAYGGGLQKGEEPRTISMPLSESAYKTSTERTIERPQVDLQELELKRVGLGSLDAASPFGPQLANVFTDDGQPVVNAAVAPQGDPRRPGGWQDRTEAAVIAQQAYGGYSGSGPRPAGWVDPDSQPS